MPRSGGGIYSAPVGTTAVSGTTIDSAPYNAFIADLVTDANAARPISAGGTGAANAAAARTSLGISATNTPFTPAGNIAATDVQAALAELDAEKAIAADTWTKVEAVTVTGPQSFTDAQKLQARVNIGTASTKNLPGATMWDKIVFAANNGYRWADVEDYEGQTISVTSRLDMGSEFQLFAGGALFDKAFNGTMFRLGDKAQIHGGKYDPKPGSFTGDMFDVLTGNNQIIRNITMRDKAEGYGLNFKASDEGGSDGAGSGMLVDGGLWIGATTGSTKAHAFKGPNIAPGTSGYARFTNISCGGTQAFDLRASRGWQITEPLIGGDNPLLFANNSFNTQIRGGRVALTGIQNVFGTNHVFDKVEIGGSFTYTLGANAAGCVFNLIGYEDIVDNSTKINRFFGCKEHSFTPTFTVSAGGPVNFGTGGSIVGFARRIDDRLRLSIVITWGTSATFGTGTYTIGLPSTFSLSSVLARRATVGGRAIYIRGTSERQGMHCDIAAGASTFVVYVDDETANFFGYLWPFTIAANDRQVIEFEYEVGAP